LLQQLWLRNEQLDQGQVHAAFSGGGEKSKEGAEPPSDIGVIDFNFQAMVTKTVVHNIYR